MFINTCLFINSLLQIKPKDYNHINQHTDKETKQTKKTHTNQKNNHIQARFQDIVFFCFVCFFGFPLFSYTCHPSHFASFSGQNLPSFPRKTWRTRPFRTRSIPFEKYVSLQIIISLEVLPRFWETHAFFKMPFQLEITFIFDFFWERTLFVTKHNTPWSVAAFWLDLLKIHAFFKMLASIGKCMIVWHEIQLLFGKCIYIYNYTYIYIYINTFVWKNCFITIQIVPWSVAAILLKNGCLFQEVWFSWECNISQNIYFDLGEFI